MLPAKSPFIAHLCLCPLFLFHPLRPCHLSHLCLLAVVVRCVSRDRHFANHRRVVVEGFAARETMAALVVATEAH